MRWVRRRYIPASCPHAVQNVELSVSLNHNFIDTTNRRRALMHMATAAVDVMSHGTPDDAARSRSLHRSLTEWEGYRPSLA